MIYDWLIKHRWVNELGKTAATALFLYFAYRFWLAGELETIDICGEASAPIMYFGVAVGIMLSLAILVVSDVVYSVIGIIKKRYSSS